MKAFNIFGDIISQDSERWSVDDVSPTDFNNFVSTVEDGEDIELHINSFGGSCTGGIAIANAIRQLVSKGHKVICYVDGCACSIASVIACACSELKMWQSSMLMIHNAWCVVQGNSETLRAEAETMDMMNKAIVSFYTSKFDLSVEELEDYMAAETWISGSEIGNYKLNATVIDAEHEFKMVASARKITFNKIPEQIKAKFMEENKDKIEEVKAEETQVENTVVENTVVEDEVKEEPKVEEPKVEDSDENMIPKAKADERVSGMQATMAKQMNAMKAEYEAKINDFTNQIKAKDEELTNAQAKVTSLESELEQAKKELSNMTSAFEDKKTALENLNSQVLRPNESAKVYDKESARKELASLPMSQRQKFYDEHKEVIG